MQSFLWQRVVGTQLTFGITLYTVKVSGSSGSKLPLAEDFRLCLCFKVFCTDCEGPQLHQWKPCRGIVCDEIIYLIRINAALNSIWLCFSFYNYIRLLVLTVSWRFQYEKVSFKFYSMTVPSITLRIDENWTLVI